MKHTFSLLIFLLIAIAAIGQSIFLEGYVYETDNRGYINQAKVDILESPSNVFLTSTLTDKDGFFKVDLPIGKKFLVKVGKDLFLEKDEIIDAMGSKPDDKKFINFELTRKPGFIFDVTIADPRKDTTETTFGIHGATIEVFNNSTEKESVRLPDYDNPNFKVTFEQGNHYTILIRKEGYYAKRMEAYVNVKGCILCFEGVGSMQPGVSDVLTAGHQMGTLLANVELKPIVLDEKTKLDDLQYATNSSKLNSFAKVELRKVVDLLEDNPGMNVELSSHTDSRGESDMNMKLSQRRAKVATEYVASYSGVSIDRVRAMGYGETRLDNRCSDGVECTERQHQSNRRTEIRILEYNQEPKSIWKPLKELKRLEGMEKLLKDLQNQEIVKIPADDSDELPEDLKKQIAIKEAAAAAKGLAKSKKERVEQTKSASTKPTEEEVIEMEKTSQKPQKSIEEMEREIEQKAAIANTKEILENEVIPEDDITLIEEEPEVATSTFQELNTLPDGYNGHKIQVHESAQRLPESHELFKVFGNLTVEKTAKGFSYLLGDFKDSKDAELFLTNIIKPRYPAAKLVKYESGRRLVYQN